MQDVTRERVDYLRVTIAENQRQTKDIIMKNLDMYGDVERCPVRNLISHFTTKWAMLVLVMLGNERCLRFSEIRRALPDISPKVLSSTLKVLEGDGLLERTLYPSVPPRVEYAITPEGDSLMPILKDLINWGLSRMRRSASVGEEAGDEA